MDWRKYGVIFILIWISHLSFSSFALGKKKIEFTILYTNDVMGEVNPSGRFRNPLGGLGKRSTLISQFRKEGKDILLLDTGNLLFQKLPQTEIKRKDSILRADLIIKSYNEMGYDAVNIGEKDFIMGVKFLKELFLKAKFPFISSNLIEKKSQKHFFKPYVIKNISGIKIGIVGLLDEQFNITLNQMDPNLLILEPINHIKNLVKGLREYCDLLIVLSQIGEMKTQKLAMEVPEIDLILGGGGGAIKSIIDNINGVPIYCLEPRGSHLGKIDYSISDLKKPLKFIPAHEYEELEKKLKSLTYHYNRIKSEIEKSEERKELRLKELKVTESKKREIDQIFKTFQGKNFYKYTTIPIELSLPDDANILKWVDIYQREFTKLYKPKVSFIPEKDLSEKELIDRIPKNSPYVGAISCKRCHELIYKNWLKTKHAKATQTIIPSPKYAQEGCLVCHSTGYGKIGEYSTVDEIPFYLQGVQCEACHGIGRGHPGKGSIKRKVTLGTCRNCHTKDQSPLFNYSAYLEKLNCKIQR